MDLQSMFSDNQLGVMGCFLALGVCGAIAALSFQFGAAGQKSTQDSSVRRSVHPIRRETTSADAASDETRRAA